MLTKNLDFMRAVCQVYDQGTDYSNYEEPEIVGAFDAIVMHLVADNRGGLEFSEPNIELGTDVSWMHAGKDRIGKVEALYPARIALKINNSVTVRHGTSKDPALKIIEDNGNTSLRLFSEVNTLDCIEEVSPQFQEPRINPEDIASLIKSEIESIDFRALVYQVIKWNNLEIGIEYRPSDIRFKGSKFERKVKSGYGHIRKHVGADGEALDCYLSPDMFDGTPSNNLYEVKQLSQDGDFDELKIMLGYPSLESAQDAYISEMSEEQFGGIRELRLKELEVYKKNHYSEIQSAIASFTAIAKQLTEAMEVEGEVLPARTLDEIAEVSEQDIERAIKDIDAIKKPASGIVEAEVKKDA